VSAASILTDIRQKIVPKGIPMSHPARQSRRSHRPRRFIPRHTTLCLALLILFVLSSVLAGSRDKSRQSVTEAVGGPAGVTQPTAGIERKQGAKPAATVSRDGGGVRPDVRGGFEISGAGRLGIEAKLFPDPSATLLRAAPAVASSAMLAAGPNNNDGKVSRDATQEETLQQDGLTAQARGEGDRVRRRPREERLTRARE
jgi:hypothetical protein